MQSIFPFFLEFLEVSQRALYLCDNLEERSFRNVSPSRLPIIGKDLCVVVSTGVLIRRDVVFFFK